jgi:arylsulfatase A-like enzyme
MKIFSFEWLAILCFGLVPFATSQAVPARPNIVVFLVDDMGIMDTSVPFLTDSEGQPKAYPLNQFYHTPHMQRLCERGIRFNQFCAMSVCSPTRVAILTGQNAARHHTTNWIHPERDNGGPRSPADWNWRGLRPEAVTLPGLLRASGYRTIHVGKGHFAPTTEAGSDPKNLGFDVNVGGAAIGQPGSYRGEEHYGAKSRPGAQGGDRAVPGLEKYHGTDTFLTEALTLEAKVHVQRAVQDEKPFFLYLAHYAVHSPFQSDKRFAERYAGSGKPPAAQAFASLVEGMDKSLGDLLDHLETLGIAENTLVFFLGDNGSDAPLGHEHQVACAAPLRGKKGSHYEGGTRVPFIAAWAKPAPQNPLQKRLPISPQTIQRQQAAVYDLFPTILQAAQTSPPRSHAVDGLPLDTLLSGKPDPGRPETFLMHYPHQPHRSNHFTSYREGGWKVVYHYFPDAQSDGARYQLFHLAEDPFEQQNLAARNPAQLKRMMERLVDSLRHHNAQYPVSAEQGGSLIPSVP